MHVRLNFYEAVYTNGIHAMIVSSLINYNFMNLQVAFGSDFSRIWSDEDLGLRNVNGSGTLGFLISHSLKGSQVSFRNPFYQVNFLLHFSAICNVLPHALMSS